MTRTNSTVGTLKTKGPQAASYDIDERIMALAVMIQMTWPGSPGIYYADEAGQVGWTDPDSRRTYPWGNENKALIDYHKAIIALRHKIHCLRLGSIKALRLPGNGFNIIRQIRQGGLFGDYYKLHRRRPRFKRSRLGIGRSERCGNDLEICL